MTAILVAAESMTPEAAATTLVTPGAASTIASVAATPVAPGVTPPEVMSTGAASTESAVTEAARASAILLAISSFTLLALSVSFNIFCSVNDTFLSPESILCRWLLY